MNPRPPESKIRARADMIRRRERLRVEGQTVVFTNGCFDIMHAGHVSTLYFARRQGDVLVVGLNADASIRMLKGSGRPILGEQERARLVGAVEAVDYVVLFEEKEVDSLVEALKPDVLVKGADRADRVVGREFVESYGGRVILAPVAAGRSTTAIVEQVRARAGA
ncbi:MAG: adenylyltransferase/cytidyltransferase family protein [Lentisphaerae bacterium]|nr:adenylyltransferase/cytidyltransferase family protein [Lentisphaerota bacterium]